MSEILETKKYEYEDYITKKVKYTDGEVKYFIKYRFSTLSQEEIEVSIRVYTLYTGVHQKPLERNRNEKRRHLDNRGLSIVGENAFFSYKTDFAEQVDTRITIETILKTCTKIQQRRFRLHHDYGHSLTEIAEIEHCYEGAVRKSVRAVEEKIKNIFSEGTNSPDF
jgi:hypothetical protein